MLQAISNFVSSRRGAWITVAIWLVLAIALGTFQPKLSKAIKNDPSQFLPGDAQSTKVLNVLKDKFPQGRNIPAIVIFGRSGPLTIADRRAIGRVAAQFAQPGALRGTLPPLSPFGPSGRPTTLGQAANLIANNRTAAIMVVSINSSKQNTIEFDVGRIRNALKKPGALPAGLQTHVTGPAGITVDTTKIFSEVDNLLEVATVSLVLILLLLVYRAPIVAVVPLLVVGFAYSIAGGLVYLLVKAGAIELNGQTNGLLIVLMYGAGTDYALLIIHRYKDELREREDKRGAMAVAAGRTSPAILASGGTVIASMLVLLVAELESTKSMGPALALGIAVMLSAGLTLLPAMMSLMGRTAFWPVQPKFGEAKPEHPMWDRIASFVDRRRWQCIVGVVLLLIVGALGNLTSTSPAGFGGGFREKTDSGQGTKLLERSFPAGQAAPTDVVVTSDNAVQVGGARAQLPQGGDGQPPNLAKDGSLAHLAVTLKGNPFGPAATDFIPKLRKVVKQVGGGGTALVGGITAQDYDTNQANKHDEGIIVPAILVLIFLILIALLRAFVAPAYLIVTVILSFAFALGVSLFAFVNIFDIPSVDEGFPLFVFIFLVALGVDYNIFLMDRVREEAEKHGIHDGVLEAVKSTGGVITSAGLILAGTFATLTILPLNSLVQIGFAVAFGILVDTFLVRTLLVPAIALVLGRRNWWPSKS
jgi:RND superfamily putative drug exporter